MRIEPHVHAVPWGTRLFRSGLGLASLSAFGCAAGPWPAAFVPVVSVLVEQRLQGSVRARTALRSAGALSVHLVVTFDGRVLRPVLPTPLDVSPALYALPCDDDDAACYQELVPDQAAAAAAYGGAP